MQAAQPMAPPPLGKPMKSPRRLNHTYSYETVTPLTVLKSDLLLLQKKVDVLEMTLPLASAKSLDTERLLQTLPPIVNGVDSDARVAVLEAVITKVRDLSLLIMQGSGRNIDNYPLISYNLPTIADTKAGPALSATRNTLLHTVQAVASIPSFVSPFVALIDELADKSISDFKHDQEQLQVEIGKRRAMENEIQSLQLGAEQQNATIAALKAERERYRRELVNLQQIFEDYKVQSTRKEDRSRKASMAPSKSDATPSAKDAREASELMRRLHDETSEMRQSYEQFQQLLDRVATEHALTNLWEPLAQFGFRINVEQQHLPELRDLSIVPSDTATPKKNKKDEINLQLQALKRELQVTQLHLSTQYNAIKEIVKQAPDILQKKDAEIAEWKRSAQYSKLLLDEWHDSQKAKELELKREMGHKLTLVEDMALLVKEAETKVTQVKEEQLTALESVKSTILIKTVEDAEPPLTLRGQLDKAYHIVSQKDRQISDFQYERDTLLGRIAALEAQVSQLSQERDALIEQRTSYAREGMEKQRKIETLLLELGSNKDKNDFISKTLTYETALFETQFELDRTAKKSKKVLSDKEKEIIEKNELCLLKELEIQKLTESYESRLTSSQNVVDALLLYIKELEPQKQAEVEHWKGLQQNALRVFEVVKKMYRLQFDCIGPTKLTKTNEVHSSLTEYGKLIRQFLADFSDNDNGWLCPLLKYLEWERKYLVDNIVYRLEQGGQSKVAKP